MNNNIKTYLFFKKLTEKYRNSENSHSFKRYAQLTEECWTDLTKEEQDFVVQKKVF